MKPLLTVFTPTYNRKNLLTNLYHHLLKEKAFSFQWLIIDDGSKDNTWEAVKKWQKENLIDIVYIKQENQGKHVAFNRAIEEADSLLFTCIDSDDYYTEGAFQELYDKWISLENKESLAGMMYLSGTEKDGYVGSLFPKDGFISDIISLYYRHGIKGDKGIIWDLSKLKKYRFPVYPGEKFVTESSLYGQIAKKYSMYCINSAYQIVYYHEGGLSDSYRRIIQSSPKGSLFNYTLMLEFKMKFPMMIKTQMQYIRFSFINKLDIKSTIKHSGARIWTLLLLVPALLFTKTQKQKKTAA